MTNTTNTYNIFYKGNLIIINEVNPNPNSIFANRDSYDFFNEYLKGQIDQVIDLLKTKGESLFGKGILPSFTYIDTAENFEYDSNNLPTEGYNTLTLVINRPMPQLYKVSESEIERAQFQSKETEQAMELAQQICHLYEDCYYSSDTKVTVTPQVITMVFSGDIPY